MSETAYGIVDRILAILHASQLLEQEAIDGAQKRALEANDWIEEEGAYLWIYSGGLHPASALRITIRVSRTCVSIFFSRTDTRGVQYNLMSLTYKEPGANTLAPGWALDRADTKASAELVRWVGDQQEIQNPTAEIRREHDPHSLRVHAMIASVIKREEPFETRI